MGGSGTGNGHSGELMVVRRPTGNGVVESAPPLENESEASEGEGEKCEEQDEARREGL